MALFPFLRWTQEHRKLVRAIDYLLGAAAIGFGIWQDSWIGIGIGVFCLFAAIINLNQRINLILPRIVPTKKPPDA
jgi:hypothetical protein